jgi:hypothetical protein
MEKKQVLYTKYTQTLKKPCFVYILSAKDTIDTIINKCIDEKNDKAVVFEKLIKSFSKFNEFISESKIEKEIENKLNWEFIDKLMK